MNSKKLKKEIEKSEKMKMNFEKWVVKLFSTFNKNEKWK